MWKQQINTSHVQPLFSWQGLQIVPGLNAVSGDEGSGKTRLLRDLAQAMGHEALWLDLRLPEHDQKTPQDFWLHMQAQYPHWNTALQNDLIGALHLQVHVDKQLFMLSAGSRRKVGLIALLSSGVTVTSLDQPYAALDRVSVRVLQDFLSDMADHPTRAWLVADYEADPELPWSSHITLT